MSEKYNPLVSGYHTSSGYTIIRNNGLLRPGASIKAIDLEERKRLFDEAMEEIEKNRAAD